MFTFFEIIVNIMIVVIAVGFAGFIYIGYKYDQFPTLAHKTIERYSEKVWVLYDIILAALIMFGIYSGLAVFALTCYLICSVAFVIWAFWYTRKHPVK